MVDPFLIVSLEFVAAFLSRYEPVPISPYDENESIPLPKREGSCLER